MNWQKELEAARVAAQEATTVLVRYLGKLRQIRVKPDAGLVSEADHESERVIKDVFDSYGLGYGFLGEETGYTPPHNESERTGRWIVDPLDGTTNYIHGFPYFCTSIGLEVDGAVVVGVVAAPLLQQTYWAVRGHGAFLNGVPLKVREVSNLEESFLSTGFSYLVDEELDDQVRIFRSLVPQTHGVRRAGAAALDLSMVASGVFDAFWERGLKAWDTSAGLLLVEEAGGVVTDYFCRPYKLESDTILAASRAIHPKLSQSIQALARWSTT